MDCVFFGSPDAALPTLDAVQEAGHRLLAVVTQPDRPVGRGLRTGPCAAASWARTHGVTLLQDEDVNAAAAGRIKVLGADVGVVVAFGQILGDAVLSSTRLGFVNIHASLLPRWRGAAPAAWAILTGDTETGVTVQRTVRRLDAGPVLAARAGPVLPDETAGELTLRLAGLGAGLLPQVLADLAAGCARETPQDEARVTWARALAKEDGRIDWTRPADEVARRVRAMAPWPGAWTMLGNRRLLIHQARALPGPAAASPGTVLDPAVLAVQAGDGPICLAVVQPEGGRVMTGAEFARGRRLAAGATLG